MNRREMLATYGAMLTAGVAGCNTPQGDRPSDERLATDEIEDWPMFLYDTANSRCFSGDFSAAQAPSIRWSYETDDAVWSSPVVVDGTLYVGSYDGHLYAISTESGEMLWRYRTGDRIDGTPAVMDGTVFFGSFDRNLYALDAESGEERWTYGTRGINRSSPTVKDGVVYVGAYTRTEEASAYYDVEWPRRGYVYAFDAESGDVRWRYETDAGVMSTPAVRDGTVYVGSADASLHAIDAESGERRWSYETSGPISSSPACVDDRVIVGNTDGEAYALDAESGDLLWSFDGNQEDELSILFTGSPVVCDGTVYLGSMATGDEIYGNLFALSASDGDREWTASSFAQGIGSSPVVVDDVVYVGSHLLDSSATADSGLHAIDDRGRVQWNHIVPGDDHSGIGSSPAIIDETLYVGCTDGRVLAFDLE